MVSEILQDENNYDSDQLFEAIAVFREEDLTSREIARKLDISLSEVELVSSILAMRTHTP